MNGFLNSIRKEQPRLEVFFIDFSPSNQSKKLIEFASLSVPPFNYSKAQHKIKFFKAVRKVKEAAEYLGEIANYLTFKDDLKIQIDSRLKAINSILDQQEEEIEKNYKKREEEIKKLNGNTFQEKIVRSQEQELKKLEIARASAQTRLEHFINQENELSSSINNQDRALSEVNLQLKDYEAQLPECTTVFFSQQEDEEINQYVQGVEAYLKVIQDEQVGLEKDLEILKRIEEIHQSEGLDILKEKIELLKRFLKLES